MFCVAYIVAYILHFRLGIWKVMLLWEKYKRCTP